MAERANFSSRGSALQHLAASVSLPARAGRVRQTVSDAPDDRHAIEGEGSESAAWLNGRLDEPTLDALLARGSRVWLELTSAPSVEQALAHLGSLNNTDLRAAILTRLALSATLPPEQLESWWRELQRSKDE